jgi:hypothetical protein
MSGKGINCWVILAGFFFVAALTPSVCLAGFCRSDIDKNGVVNGSDKSLLDAEVGRDDCFSVPCSGDLNNDGKVDNLDRELLKRELGRDDCFADREEEGRLQPEKKGKTDIDKENDEHESALSQTRFLDNRNGTVTDPKTGLMWTKDANFFEETVLFHQALNYIDQMNSGERSNFGYTDWRLPTLEELRSLIDYTKLKKWKHEIPSGHPFQNIKSINFNGNNIATCLQNSKHKWFVSGYCRLVGRNVRFCYGYAWPVRNAR